MLMIRLQRVGRKNDPSFRAVVVDSHASAKSGKALEVVGSYNSRNGEPILKADRIKYWLSVGARLSDTMHNLLIKKGIITGKKKDVAPKKPVVITEEKPVEKTQAVSAEEVKVEENISAPEEPKIEEENTATEESPVVSDEIPAEPTA